MRIQHNIMAMSAYRNYTNNVSAMKKNLEKLSSGYKINRAGDDAAGLAISEKMRAQITGLETAQKNAKDGISLVQTAEGALTEVHDMLNRMVELASQSANGTYDDTTDRAQMEKELKQLKSEINRIADSSNFNGIKLLDGSLGMNTEGYQVGKVIDAVEAGQAENITSTVLNFATAGAGSNSYHGIVGTAQVEPQFSVNLGDLKITAGTASAIRGSSITFSIGSKTFTLGSATLAAGSTWAAATIASKLAAEINQAFASGSGWNVGSSGLVVTASAVGAEIKFTFAGVAQGASTVSTTVKFTKDQADNFNAIFGGDFSVTGLATLASGTGVIIEGQIDHEIYKAKDAVSDQSQRAGIDVTLSPDLIKDGNQLTIGSQTFTFKVGKDSTVAAGNNTIDLSKLDADATAGALLREAILQLSNKSTAKYDLHNSDADSGKLHIEQTVSHYASGANAMTAEDIRKEVSAQAAASKPANAAVELTLDTTKLKKNDTVSIDDNKFAYDKDFKTVDELKTLIEGKGYTVEKTDNKLTIYAKTAEAGAPSVLGNGLTLQIGDTAEEFNQLNVAVKDCHVKSLGLENVSIANQDSAAKAVDAIKAAINYVSDVRGTLGATQNRLDHTINNLSVMTENIQDAESTIRDVDVAEEMMAYTKNNILIQSAQAMLAQANQVPQGVLQLLQ